jgi:hypothetical protein
MSKDAALSPDVIVSNFVCNTCQLCPQPNKYALYGVTGCFEFISLNEEERNTRHFEGELIPTVTGSVSEFYIEPMLPHIGDVDIMVYRSDDLAIPAGHSPPQQLPEGWPHNIVVIEIEDSPWSGYVYLERSGDLIKPRNSDYYTFVAGGTVFFLFL